VTSLDSARPDVFLRILTRVLKSLSSLLTGSAVLVLCAIPVSWLDRWHLLPAGMLFALLLFPFIIAWLHAGIFFVLIVAGCEAALHLLKPKVGRARMGATVAVGICVLAQLYIYLSKRFNLH